MTGAPSVNAWTPVSCATSSPIGVSTCTKVSEPEISASSTWPGSAMSPARGCTRKAPARMPTVSAGARDAGSATASCTSPRKVTPSALAAPAIRFIGGSLKARATRIDCGRWNTSAVGPYCSSSPASSTAV